MYSIHKCNLCDHANLPYCRPTCKKYKIEEAIAKQRKENARKDKDTTSYIIEEAAKHKINYWNWKRGMSHNVR